MQNLMDDVMTTPTKQPKKPRSSNKTGIPFSGFMSFLLVSFGLLSLLLPFSRAFSAKQKPKPHPCQRQHDGTLRGDFRTLGCFIVFRRTKKALNHTLDPIILRLFAKLYQRLRKETTDWRALARWQALYILGTRLYPIQNKWAAHAEIPVYEVNGHHLSFPFWLKESMRRKVGTLFHVDTHSDMKSILYYKDALQSIRDLKRNPNDPQAWHTIAHTIYDHAMPVTGAVLSKAYHNIVWAKPHWSIIPNFVKVPFLYAVKKKKKIKFSRRSNRKSSSMFTPQAGYFQLYFDPRNNNDRKLIPRDIGPWLYLTKDLFPIKKHFEQVTPFKFSIITTDYPIDKQGRGKGAAHLKKVLKAIPPGPFTLDIDLDYFASIDYTKGFRRSYQSRVKWLNFHTFRNQRKFLKKRFSHFHNLLSILKAKGRIPALVTIADSTFMSFAFDKVAEGHFAYTPSEHTAFLRHHLRKLLRKIYGHKITGRGRTPQARTTPKNGNQPRATKPREHSLRSIETLGQRKTTGRTAPETNTDKTRKKQAKTLKRELSLPNKK